MSPKDLEKLAKVCQKYAITYIRTEQVELKLETPSPSLATANIPLSDNKPETDYTEEEIALWSSPGINQ